MSQRTKFVLTALVLIGVVVFGYASVPARAQTDQITARGIWDINIRTAPTVNSSIIGVLPANSNAIVIGRNEGNNWVQVEFQGTTGWMASWLLAFTADPFDLDVTTEIETEPLISGDPNDVISIYNVNIREEPRVSADLVATLSFGTDAVATARNRDSNWVYVEWGNIEGWSAAWLLILSNDINGLPVAGVDTPVATTPPPDDQGEDEDEDADDDADATPTGTVTVTATTPAPDTGTPPPDSDISVTSPYNVNMRTSPTTGASVVAGIGPGQSAVAVGRNAGNNWIQVRKGDELGWVAAWLVIADGATSTLPVTSDVADVEIPPPDGVITGASTLPVTLRAGTALTFGELGEIPPNTRVTLIARTEDSDWLKVTYNGVEGWVAAWIMTANADWNNLPVE